MSCLTCSASWQVRTDFALPRRGVRQAVIPRDPDQALQGGLAARARQPVVLQRPGRRLLCLRAPPCERMADLDKVKSELGSHLATVLHGSCQVEMAGQPVGPYGVSVLLSMPVTSRPQRKDRGLTSRNAHVRMSP